MKFQYRVKIKHEGTILFNRKVKAKNVASAYQKATEVMLTEGKLKKGKDKPMKVGGHWWKWTKATGLEVTITRLKILAPKGMK